MVKYEEIIKKQQNEKMKSKLEEQIKKLIESRNQSQQKHQQMRSASFVGKELTKLTEYHEDGSNMIADALSYSSSEPETKRKRVG